MKVHILGNSVAFRMRPPRSKPNEATYAELLSQAGHHVQTIARSGTLLSEAFATLEEDVITSFPDVVIIHYGIAEVCHRQTVRWINNKTIENYYLNSRFNRPYATSSRTARLRRFFWRILNGLIRRAAAISGVSWQWLPQQQLLEVMKATVHVLRKETNAFIVIIGINQCTERVERLLAGSSHAILEANREIEEWVRGSNSRVTYVDPGTFINPETEGNLIPDGVHFSAEGHRQLAMRLNDILTQLNPQGRAAGPAA